MKTVCKDPPKYFTTGLRKALQNHFEALYPQEACGAICASPANDFYFFPLQNVAVEKRCSFYEMEHSDVMSLCMKSHRGDLKILAWVHSHPQGQSEASEHDRAFWWADQQWLWPGMDQIILWPKSSEGLQMSIYGPQTQRLRPLPYFKGPLKRL